MKNGQRFGAMVCVMLGAIAMAAPCAHAQSLFRQRAMPMSDPGAGPTSLAGYSLMYVAPPEPRSFLVHDLVTIIIDETSRSTSEQTLETSKSYNLDGALLAFPDLKRLLDLQFRTGAGDNLARVGMNYNNRFAGDGEYERNDRMVARVAGRIIDVKPNGTVVIEAKRVISNDEERKTIIVSGICRMEDITAENTVLSAQVADLRIEVINEGEVRRAGRKGLIPRVMDAVFAF